ncbi:hypothetical protein [Jiella avicenniae]|uniref:Uncharacterized protein n=1 Tax=Jiella avicenniae TaxID=2907202 RepID=A0A9X1T7H7_9HYPH|nr:hypothetical protein [Jiella avicenniae]MCE7030909.1 hypothetical protein [Jiella avicenniae]
MDRRRSHAHRFFLAVFLLAQATGFNGEGASGTRRAIEILAGQKSVALIPPVQAAVAIYGDTLSDFD